MWKNQNFEIFWQICWVFCSRFLPASRRLENCIWDNNLEVICSTEKTWVPEARGNNKALRIPLGFASYWSYEVPNPFDLSRRTKNLRVSEKCAAIPSYWIRLSKLLILCIVAPTADLKKFACAPEKKKKKNRSRNIYRDVYARIFGQFSNTFEKNLI